MSRNKAAKAKATRAAKAKAAQSARAQALEANALVVEAAPAKSKARRMLTLRGAREMALTVGAITGVVCMLLAVAAFAFGIQPVVFRSGSMSPAIDTGALAISKSVDAKDLAVGDIVTVKTGAGIRVTHRIQNVTLANGNATLVLRGDANKVPDDKAYVVKTADRVLFDIPKAGYVVSWVSGPVGIFAGGLLVGLLMLTAFGPGSGTNKPGTRRLWGGAVAVLAIGVCTTGAAGVNQTQAYYTDTAALTSGTFDRIPKPAAPVITGCVGSNNSLKLTWTESPDPVTFEFRYGGVPHPAESFSGTLRTNTTIANLNNPGVLSSIWIVAINASGTSADSVHYFYSGNRNSKVCAP